MWVAKIPPALSSPCALSADSLSSPVGAMSSAPLGVKLGRRKKQATADESAYRLLGLAASATSMAPRSPVVLLSSADMVRSVALP